MATRLSFLWRPDVGCLQCKITGCVILDHVTIEDGAVLTVRPCQPSQLTSRCTAHALFAFQNCLVSSNATIGAKCALSNCRVASSYVVKADSKLSLCMRATTLTSFVA